MNTGAKGQRRWKRNWQVPIDLPLTQNPECSGALTDRGASPREQVRRHRRKRVEEVWAPKREDDYGLPGQRDFLDELRKTPLGPHSPGELLRGDIGGDQNQIG